MFRPGSGAVKGGVGSNSSESDSDWDTTVDFPTPRHEAGQNSVAEDSHVPPTPRTRASHTGKVDGKGDATPKSGRRDEGAPLSGRRDRETRAPASASAVFLSTGSDSGSRNPSPVPPFTGFQGALKNGEDTGVRRTPSPPKERRDRRYELSPTPRIPTSMDAAGPTPNWDDSDAEQQTLRELRTNLQKEKTRESESVSARKQYQDDGDHSTTTGRNPSTLEKWMQGQEDKRRHKRGQDPGPPAVVSQDRKTGLSTVVDRGQMGENLMPPHTNAPYQSLFIKDPDGKKYIYFFSEGNTAYYEVEEEESKAVMPKVADKVEGYIQRGWQEFFGVLRIVTSILILLVVEVFNYVTNHIARPLFLGIVVMTGNRLVKPVLAAVFNLIIQPFVIFSWNIVSGMRHVSQPLVDIFGAVMAKTAVLLRAFRLVEVNLGDDYLRSRASNYVGIGRGIGNESEVV